MSTSRPFSYYNGYTPLNTDKYGNILVGLTGVSLTDGGLSWFNGPDEDLGYVIAHDGGTNRTYGNNFGPIAGTSVGFWRSVDKTDNSFLNIAANVGQTFSSASNAKTWLESNGHWTSYVSMLETLTSTYSIFLFGGFQTFAEPFIRDYSIVKINTDGSKDTSFDNQNKFPVSTFTTANDIRVSTQTPDGYILIVSNTSVSYGGSSSFVHLINPDGSRVNSGNIYNSTQLPIDIWAGMKDIVWDKSVGGTHSGKFYVGFDSPNIVAGGHTVSRIARYNSDYTIDKTFNTYVSSAQSGFNNTVNKIKILTDGNILVVGAFTQYKGSALTSNYICKLDPNGNIISSFNTGGSGPSSQILCADEDTSGNIYIGGFYTGFNGTTTPTLSRINKLNPNGTRNTSFSSPYTSGFVIQIIADPNDGNIFVLNNQPSNTTKGIAKLLSSTGALSGSWVSGYDLNTSASKAVFASASNSLYVFGPFTTYIDNVYNGMLKLNGTTGIANGTFSNDSVLAGAIINNLFPRDCFIDNSGKIFILGGFSNFKSPNYLSIGISPNGSIDNSFNASPPSLSGERNHGAISDNKGNYFIWSIDKTGWEKTFFAGSSTNYDAIPNNGNASGVVKISSTGSLVTSYVPRINQLSGLVYAVDLDSTRYQLYIGGNFTRTSGITSTTGTLIPKICRVSATSGVIDNTFVTGTGFRSSIPGTEGSSGSPFVYAIKYDPIIDKVYCGGSFAAYNGLTASRIIRLTSTGSYDQTFQVYTSSTQSGFNNNVLDIQVDRTGGEHDGKIYCGGDFTSYKGVTLGKIARLNTDGSLDTTFSTGTGFGGQVADIIVLPDGKIFVGNYGTQFNGSTISYICRLNTDGSLDTTFDTGIGFQFGGLTKNVTTYTGGPIIRTIRYDPSGKLYVMGSFGKYRGEAKNCIVRINMDGTIDNTFNDNGYGLQSLDSSSFGLVVY